MFNATPTPIVE